PVLDGEQSVDDVLVVSDEQQAPARARARGVAVDLDGLDLREVDDLHRFDRERQVPARARRGRLGVLAEASDHAPAAFGDDVEAAGEPYQQHERGQESRAAEREPGTRRLADVGAVPGLATAEQLAQPAVETAPDFVEIGRSAAAALTPLRIVEGHGGCPAGGRLPWRVE